MTRTLFHQHSRRAGVSVCIGIACLTLGWIAGHRSHLVTADTHQAAQEPPAGRTENLLRDLKATDRETRRRAVEELGRTNDERVVAPLVDVLRNDPDFLVRSAAAEGLGALKSKSALKPLLEALAGTQSEVRGAAALALGRLGDQQAVPRLQSALHDPEPFVRSSAAQSLGRLGAAGAAADLIVVLQDTEAEVRTSAAEALGLLGNPSAVEPLLRVLTDASPYVRSRAALALGKLADARAVTPLIDALKDSERMVRANAAESLARFKDRRAVRPLIERLYDRDIFVRTNAAYALGRIGDESAVDNLTELLRDEDARVRSRAVDALGNLAAARSLDAILDTLKDNDKVVRGTVVQALGNFTDPKAVDALLQTMSETDAALRRRAVESLGKIGDARALPALQAALSDTSAGVRVGAVMAYGKLGKEQAVPALLEALREPDAQVRAAAAFALGQVRTPETLNGVLALLGSSDWASAVRLRPTYEAFFKAYGDALAQVESGLKSGDAKVRRGSLIALDVVLNAPNTTQALVAALNDSSVEIRRTAIDGLVRGKSPVATDALLSVLTNDADAGLRVQAAGALGILADNRNPQMAETLRRVYDKDASVEVREKTGEALDKLGLARVVLPSELGGKTQIAINVPSRVTLPTVPPGSELPAPPEVRSPQPEVRSPQPEVRSPQPAVPADSKSQIPKPTVELTNSGQPTADNRQRAKPENPQVALRAEPSTPAKPPTPEPAPKPAPPTPDTRPRTSGPAPRTPNPEPRAPNPAVSGAALMAANEAATLDFMRTLLQAERNYKANVSKGQFAGLVDLITRGLIDAKLATGESNGYRFTLYVSQATTTSAANFFVLATPVGFDETGRRSFFLDSTGVARAREARDGVRLEEIFSTWSHTELN